METKVIMNLKETEIIKVMLDKPSNYSVLALNKDITQDQINTWNLPEIYKGEVILSRRRLFFFWLFESIIKEEFDIGNYYSWVRNSRLTFIKEPNNG